MITNSKVLVVEADQAMRETLVQCLEELGLKVVSASDGLEALDRLAERPAVGLVVTELRLPNFDGAELIRVMRETDNAAPVVVFTSRVPQCFKSIPGVTVFDKLGEASKLLRHIRSLTA